MYGLIELPWWGYILVVLFLTHITILTVTIFLHRHQAHRAIELSPIVSHFFRAWLWLTTGMETKAWAAIHRKHHARCETEEDPHSPQVLGLSKVLWQGAELYRKEAQNLETLNRYGAGTPCDWLENNLYTRHSKKGVLITLIVNLILFGAPGLTIWAVQMAWIPFWAAGVINGLGHYFGYRNFECKDASTNIFPIGILIGGEELHNNHHAYPSSAKLSTKWWEFDIGWFYIRILSFLGLAQIKRSMPRIVVIPERQEIDKASVETIIYNHWQILADYSSKVLFPIFKSELRKYEPSRKEIWSKVQQAIKRSDLFQDKFSNTWLTILLRENKKMNLVYTFRNRLIQFFKETASEVELIQEISKWCNDAESSGLDVLKNFGKYLKSISHATA